MESILQSIGINLDEVKKMNGRQVQFSMYMACTDFLALMGL